MTNKMELFKIVNQKDVSSVLRELTNWEEFDLSLVNEEGQSPLHLAVLSNRIEIVAVLLKAGYDPNQQDHGLLSPFIAAAANGFSEVFALLLQYSPNVNQVNRFGGTALLPSSEKGFIPVVQKALSAGVPVNHVNRLGWSALLEVAVLGNDSFLYRDIVEELIAHGADPKAVDFEGKNAIDYARQLGHLLIEGALRKVNTKNKFSEVKEQIRNQQFYPALRKTLEFEESLEQLYYLGVIYEQLKAYDAASYYYQQGLAKDPQFAYYLANLSKKMGHVAETLAYFEQGASFPGQLNFYRYHQSNYLRELGRHEEAIELMDGLLSRQPKRVDYLFHKANSLRSLGKHQQAYDAMVLASLLQPDNQLFQEHLKQSKQNMNRMEVN